LRAESAKRVAAAQARADASGGDRYSAYTKEGQGLLAQGYGTEAETMGKLAGKSQAQIEEDKLKARKLAGDAAKAGIVELSPNERAVDVATGKSYSGNAPIFAPQSSGSGSADPKGENDKKVRDAFTKPGLTLKGKQFPATFDAQGHENFIKWTRSQGVPANLNSLNDWDAAGRPYPSSAPAAGKSAGGGKLPQPKSAAEHAALPRGAEYLDPQGVRRIKK
jgi:hypothetical protein